MKVLVTGLCLQGNKGGPALALSLMQEIGKRLNRTTFVLSVPAGKEFVLEQAWAQKYGQDIVPGLDREDVVYPLRLRSWPERLVRAVQWIRVLRQSDALVDLTAISYVGPPTGARRDLLIGGRFLYFLAARLFMRPILAWTQSYGPFTSQLCRFVARLDLSNQPIIFCRGPSCYNNVKKFLPHKQARSYPDVAVVLGYDPKYGGHYIQRHFPNIKLEKLVTISPSSVLHSRTLEKGGTSRHLDEMLNLCYYLIRQNYHVLLVPHTYRLNMPDPLLCDMALAKIIQERATSMGAMSLVEEDLSPVDLKSIIGCAQVHIGGRYHSVVAALSTGVPCIALSWHGKYRDIMEFYGLDHFVHDIMSGAGERELFALFDELEAHRDRYAALLHKTQIDIESQVAENANLFTQLLKDAVK